MKISGIYKIQSIIKPGRIYIGSAIDIGKRWSGHIGNLKKHKHHSLKLQNHFNKYGESDLQFSVLLGCEKEDLLKNEQFFLDSYDPYFNICKIAGSNLGRKCTKQTKLNMSISKKGKKIKPHSEDHKNKIRERLRHNKNNLGKHWRVSDIGRKNISESKSGEKNPFYGKKHSQKSIDKEKATKAINRIKKLQEIN